MKTGRLEWHQRIAFLLLVISTSSWAQTPAPATVLPVHSAPVDSSAEDSRLRQMESIYQQQLRARHIPLLGLYLTDLQAHAAKASDPAPFRAEIDRVQAIISGGGVVDLSAAVQTLQASTEIPVPTPMPMPRKSSQGLVMLTADLARSISPLPAGSASPNAAAVGQIEWLIETLPAGSYEMVLQYACPDLAGPLSLSVEYGGQKLEAALDKDKGTQNARTFRILRLGQMTLAAETKGQILRLTAGTKDGSALLLRSLVITRAKAEN